MDIDDFKDMVRKLKEKGSEGSSTNAQSLTTNCLWKNQENHSCVHYLKFRRPVHMRLFINLCHMIQKNSAFRVAHSSTILTFVSKFARKYFCKFLVEYYSLIFQKEDKIISFSLRKLVNLNIIKYVIKFFKLPFIGICFMD